MPTTENKVLTIATTKSTHMLTTPPNISNIPPMAPPTPVGVPAPFPYMSRSAMAKKTSTKLIIGRGETLIVTSSLDLLPPANQPSQPAPIHDVITMMVKQKAFSMMM
jgi:hypothetical protein